MFMIMFVAMTMTIAITSLMMIRAMWCGILFFSEIIDHIMITIFKMSHYQYSFFEKYFKPVVINQNI